MTYKAIKYIVAGVFVLVTVLGGTLMMTSKNSTQSVQFQKLQPDVISISASYPKYHPDLKSLYEDADIVVLGKINKVKPSKKNDNLIFTDSEVNVIKYYKNPQEFKNIIIQQDGGTIEGTEYRNADLSIFNRGEEYLLFLKHITDNRYFVISPVALYKVENGNAKHKEEARNKSFDQIEKDLEKIKNAK